MPSSEDRKSTIPNQPLRKLSSLSSLHSCSIPILRKAIKPTVSGQASSDKSKPSTDKTLDKNELLQDKQKFISTLSRFMGSSVRSQTIAVGRRHIDTHALFCSVMTVGGYNASLDWSRIALSLGLASELAAELRKCYEFNLLQFDKVLCSSSVSPAVDVPSKRPSSRVSPPTVKKLKAVPRQLSTNKPIAIDWDPKPSRPLRLHQIIAEKMPETLSSDTSTNNFGDGALPTAFLEEIAANPLVTVDKKPKYVSFNHLTLCLESNLRFETRFALDNLVVRSKSTALFVALDSEMNFHINRLVSTLFKVFGASIETLVLRHGSNATSQSGISMKIRDLRSVESINCFQMGILDAESRLLCDYAAAIGLIIRNSSFSSGNGGGSTSNCGFYAVLVLQPMFLEFLYWTLDLSSLFSYSHLLNAILIANLSVLEHRLNALVILSNIGHLVDTTQFPNLLNRVFDVVSDIVDDTECNTTIVCTTLEALVRLMLCENNSSLFASLSTECERLLLNCANRLVSSATIFAHLETESSLEAKIAYLELLVNCIRMLLSVASCSEVVFLKIGRVNGFVQTLVSLARLPLTFPKEYKQLLRDKHDSTRGDGGNRSGGCCYVLSQSCVLVIQSLAKFECLRNSLCVFIDGFLEMAVELKEDVDLQILVMNLMACL